jgi:flagellin-like hook-associated protein FlgL
VSSGPSASVAESSANLEQAIQNLISAGTIQDIALSRAGNEITLRSTTAGSLFSVTDTSQTSSKVLAMRIETPTIPDIDISSSDLASSAISAIDIAINAIIKSRASVGAYINTLAHVGDNISNSMQQTIASRSTIMDADYAIETSHLAKSQIIQQAANAMLVHANLQTLSVMELFKSH